MKENEESDMDSECRFRLGSSFRQPLPKGLQIYSKEFVKLIPKRLILESCRTESEWCECTERTIIKRTVGFHPCSITLSDGCVNCILPPHPLASEPLDSN